MPDPEIPRPRLKVEDKHRVVARIVDCSDPKEAGMIAEHLWAKLRGDMQDRITSLIYAVRSAVDNPNLAEDAERVRRNLQRELKMLDGKEMAATALPKKGPPTDDDLRSPGPGPRATEAETKPHPPPLATHAAQITRGVPREEILAARTKKGAWTREQLASWGIAWPPPRGWRRRLEHLDRRERSKRGQISHEHSD